MRQVLVGQLLNFYVIFTIEVYLKLQHLIIIFLSNRLKLFVYVLEVNNGFIAQWFIFGWSNLTEVIVDLPIAFQGYYSPISTDIGVARICYATTCHTKSQIKIFSPNATGIAARCIAIGY